MKKRLTAAALCLILLAGALAGCHNNPPQPSETGGTGQEAFSTAASYEDVSVALAQADDDLAALQGIAYGASSAVRTEDIAEMAAEDSASVEYAEMGSETASAGEEYSETNTQVAGVDEGDIVKTDGAYIYILRDDSLIIARANGAETAVISQTSLEAQERPYYSFYEMYVSDGTAAIFASGYSETASGEDRAQTRLYLYDVSNPEVPVLRDDLGQDGSFLTSRRIGNMVYVVSTYSVYETTGVDVEDMIPAVYTGTTSTLVPEGSIAIMPGAISKSFSVVAAYDLESGEITGTYSALGNSGTIYMNSESLYLAGPRYDFQTGEGYTEGPYTVTEQSSSIYTDIVRLDISGGTPVAGAAGSVPGHLNDQFSMDEWEGNLRLVTTVMNHTWRVYEDENHDWSNSETLEDSTTNALYVLGSDMQIAGSVENLAEDETIYSARFDGEIGYFVTFRQVDPLFAVDLSDPSSPTVLSTLKIPGFSQYLHVYSQGRLFGLGYDADTETGAVGTLKLSMFNTEDPADVSEQNTLILENGYSEALYNHKAILISQEKDIIAFPVPEGYAVYGYSDEKGFYLKGEIASEIATYLNYNTRGLYIGDAAYIVDRDGIRVLDLEGLSELVYLTY